MIIPKSSGVPLFAKLSSQSPELFRKGYNSLKTISGGINTVGNYARGLRPVISAYNPAIGSAIGMAGGLAPKISQSLDSLVKSAKNIKRIEKDKPMKKYY